MLTLPFDTCRWQEDERGFWLCLLIPKGKRGQCSEFVRTFKGPHTASIAKGKKGRSLDANAYCWLLLGRLGAKLGITPDEAYRQYIPDIGDNFMVVPIREDKVQQWEELWRRGHVGRMCDDLGESRKTPGYHNVRCYIGSSDFDSAQMGRLIDMVIEDCKAQGIETLPPEKIAAMKEEWR